MNGVSNSYSTGGIRKNSRSTNHHKEQLNRVEWIAGEIIIEMVLQSYKCFFNIIPNKIFFSKSFPATSCLNFERQWLMMKVFFKNVFSDRIVTWCYYCLLMIAGKFSRAIAIFSASGKHKSK